MPDRLHDFLEQLFQLSIDGVSKDRFNLARKGWFHLMRANHKIRLLESVEDSFLQHLLTRTIHKNTQPAFLAIILEELYFRDMKPMNRTGVE